VARFENLAKDIGRPLQTSSVSVKRFVYFSVLINGFAAAFAASSGSSGIAAGPASRSWSRGV
jgi:hypothetical protein